MCFLELTNAVDDTPLCINFKHVSEIFWADDNEGGTIIGLTSEAGFIRVKERMEWIMFLLKKEGALK